MDELLESIRTAVATDASDEARTAGAAACRTLVSVLEAKAGEPLALPVPSAQPTTTVAAVVTALRGMPPDQLLDLLIAKLRTIVPPERQPASEYRLAFPFLRKPAP
jgi:hypothetical protein